MTCIHCQASLAYDPARGIYFAIAGGPTSLTHRCATAAHQVA